MEERSTIFIPPFEKGGLGGICGRWRESGALESPSIPLLQGSSVE